MREEREGGERHKKKKERRIGEEKKSMLLMLTSFQFLKHLSPSGELDCLSIAIKKVQSEE